MSKEVCETGQDPKGTSIPGVDTGILALDPQGGCGGLRLDNEVVIAVRTILVAIDVGQ